MKFISQFVKSFHLYKYFLVLALLNVFFSTDKIEAKTFLINDIEISTPFEINFDKNQIIEEGFVQAFNQLMFKISKSNDHTKLNKTSLNKIKSMVETFSIDEEKFINEIYYLKLNVSFNKKSIFNHLENLNIFPSIPLKKELIFVPILIDQTTNEIKIFSDNIFYNNWNLNKKNYNLLNYILPSEDLEDYNLIRNNIGQIENFNFYEIINKYNLKDHIIAIFFIENKQVKILNKIYLDNEKKIKNLMLKNINLNNQDEINKSIGKLKTIYEDHWKQQNEINTSMKLELTISIDNSNNIEIKKFEENLSKIDLIYNFYIYKFDNNNNYYNIVFNGTPDKFLKTMKKFDYKLETKNKIWVVK